MNSKVLLIALIGSLFFAVTTWAKGPGGPHGKEVFLYEDWPLQVPVLEEGMIRCPGGEILWADEVTPVCTGSGRIHIRGVSGYGCYTALDASGLPVPELSGVGRYVVNGNLDADYTGPVWGSYMIVPAPDCDPARLAAPEVYWKGTWRGRRMVTCGPDSCTWVGHLKLVGKGRGGDLEGLHFKGTEAITTFTPLPVPWELIPIPGFPTGPEGVGTGVIR